MAMMAEYMLISSRSLTRSAELSCLPEAALTNQSVFKPHAIAVRDPKRGINADSSDLRQTDVLFDCEKHAKRTALIPWQMEPPVGYAGLQKLFHEEIHAMKS